jgi:cytochrome P450
MSILSHRKQEEKSGKTSRKDFINLLMEAKEQDGRGLSREEISDQIILFFVAGYDTSAASLSSICYCLAMNQMVQEKLYNEVKTFMNSSSDEENFMEDMNQLKYLDAVIKESMRFLPIVPRMERRCNKDCILQTDDYRIFVPRDAMIIIPIYSLNHDTRYFRNPDRFDPERFLDPEQELLMASAYLPFATGPRSCIGQRFAMMELRACMIHVVSRFEFAPCSETGLQYFRGNPVSTTRQVCLKVRRRRDRTDGTI